MSYFAHVKKPMFIPLGMKSFLIENECVVRKILYMYAVLYTSILFGLSLGKIVVDFLFGLSLGNIVVDFCNPHFIV